MHQDAEREGLLAEQERLRSKLKDAQQHIERLKRREAERANVGGKAAKDYQSVIDEKDALEEKVRALKRRMEPVPPCVARGS